MTAIRDVTAIRETPLYRQVADWIARDLGESPAPGDRLASERALCERYQVSRVTLRSALKLLAQDGLLSASAARGWFVAAAAPPPGAPPAGAAAPAGGVAGFTELAAGRGQSTSAQVLAARRRPATVDEAERLGAVPGADLFELRRLRMVEGLVIAVDESLVPLSVCPGITEHDFTTESLYEVLRSAADPVVPSLADYAVEAVPAEAEVAGLLQMPAGMPVLVARQVTRDQYARTIELGVTCYRGDRFRFRASIGALPPGEAAVRTPRGG